MAALFLKTLLYRMLLANNEQTLCGGQIKAWVKLGIKIELSYKVYIRFTPTM